LNYATSTKFFGEHSNIGKYPAMDIPLLLLECYGSEIIFDRSMSFLGGQNEKRMDGLDRTFCNSLFHSEMVLGKNMYLLQSRREESIVNVSESVGSYEQAGSKVNRMELWKSHEDLCRKEASGHSSCGFPGTSTLRL